MQNDFMGIVWASVACGVVLVGTVAGMLYASGETVHVRVGTVTMADAGVAE